MPDWEELLRDWSEMEVRRRGGPYCKFLHGPSSALRGNPTIFHPPPVLWPQPPSHCRTLFHGHAVANSCTPPPLPATASFCPWPAYCCAFISQPKTHPRMLKLSGGPLTRPSWNLQRAVATSWTSRLATGWAWQRA